MVNVPSWAVWIATVLVVELYLQLRIALPSLSTDRGFIGTFTIIRDGPAPLAEKTILFEVFSNMLIVLMVELNAR